MTKTYCDRCGKETKKSSYIHLPVYNEEGKRPKIRDTKSYEICNACVDETHEFLKEKK